MGDDPSMWRREMEADWVEDDNVWLTQSLIASGIGTQKNLGQELHEFNAQECQSGEFYAGIDLAQTRDFSVLAVL
jgi:phage terminase large subunit-like protein